VKAGKLALSKTECYALSRFLDGSLSREPNQIRVCIVLAHPQPHRPFVTLGWESIMTPSILGQATLQALKCLKESGERSFEKLTATFLSLLIGFPIRLCKSS
jgi:hypothetical protein